MSAAPIVSAATIFTEFSRQAGERTALITPAVRLSYAELHRNVVRLANTIAAMDGDAVAIPADAAEPLLTAFLACAAAGRPALILDPARPIAESRRLAERYQARFPSPEQAPIVSLPHVPSEAEFYWGLTSGTTGEPKLFARSHRSWLASFAAAERVFPFPPAAKVLIPGPLSHSLFLYGAVHALCRRHTLIAPGAFRPDRAAAAAREAGAIWLVPAMLSEMLDHGLADDRARLIFCGGAKLSPDLRARCEAAMPRADLIEFYGASETSFITYAATSAPAPAGSVGRPFPGVRIDIRGEGEIHVASPMLFSRYAGGAPASEWFTAGDIGFVDQGGFLHLTGRANRIINSSALKIRPEPIEQALLDLPGVLRAAVVDLPDATRGAIAVAAIEFAPGRQLARRTLSEHCRSRLGARFSPHRYYQADALPLTRSGKIALARVREALLAASPNFRELR